MAIKYKVYYSPCLPLYTYKMEENSITANIAEYYVGKDYSPQTIDVVWHNNDDIKAFCRFLDKKLLRYMGKKIYKIDKIEMAYESWDILTGDRDSDYYRSFAERNAYTVYNSATITTDRYSYFYSADTAYGSATDRYNYSCGTAVNGTRRDDNGS